MKALIDGDILCYQYGSLTDERGSPLTWNLIVNHLNAKIKEICDKVDADECIIFMTGNNNFRKEEATIKPYKGTRPAEKPHSYERVKAYLESGKVYPVTICEDYEADDGMSIAQTDSIEEIESAELEVEMHGTYHGSFPQDTCICSNDKDLRMVPGYHYSWSVGEDIKEKPMEWVDHTQGLRWFFTQLLTGDSVDNILGIFGMGPKSAAVLRLKDMEDTIDMYLNVQLEYEKRFGNYWKMFMYENARLLWMLRTEDDDIRNFLEKLESQRQNIIKESEEF